MDEKEEEEEEEEKKEECEDRESQESRKQENEDLHVAIIYLTSRPFSMVSLTRDFLDKISDGTGDETLSLPRGPLIMNSDKVMAALYREVVTHTAGEKKAQTLNKIRDLFNHSYPLLSPSPNKKSPFIAGFGNQPSDEEAYQSVDISNHLIFTINPESEITTLSQEDINHFSGYGDIKLMEYCYEIMNKL